MSKPRFFIYISTLNIYNENMQKRYGNVQKWDDGLLAYRISLLKELNDKKWDEFADKNLLHIQNVMASKNELLLLPKDKAHAVGLL